MANNCYFCEGRVRSLLGYAWLYIFFCQLLCVAGPCAQTKYMKYGYLYESRYSTPDDKEKLKPFGVTEFYYDTLHSKRPELDKLLSIVVSGDIIYVPRFSQLGRTYKQMFFLAEKLLHQGVKLYSVEDDLDLSIFFALGEADRQYLLAKNPDILKQRFTLGARGKPMGRKPKDEAIKLKALEMYSLGRALWEIRKETDLSNTTIYKTVRKHQAQMDFSFDPDEYYKSK